MKKLAVIGVAVGLVFGLASCGKAKTEGGGDLKAYNVPLPDGKTVVCVSDVYDLSSGGGISCDWANAK